MKVRHSRILRTAGDMLLPLLLLFSLFLLLRGHDLPGGGFIAGLVAAAAIALYIFSRDMRSARQVLGADPRSLLGVGLVIAILSGVPGLLAGDAFLTSEWYTVPLPGGREFTLGTPIIFDVGVYLVVIGAVMTIVLSLAEAEERPWKR